MGKKKRWGKKHEDKRDWKAYNEKLVKRGEFYINPRFLDSWNREVKEMNAAKEGNPYLYPDSMVEFASVLHNKGFDYRAVEGIFRGLSPHFHNFPVISYSQICRRVNQLDVEFDLSSEGMIVGADGSGMKVSNRGDWMRHKWKVKKGWIKVTIMGNTKGDIVDVRVGNEDMDERKSSRGMVREHKKRIKTLLGDGLHYCEETFNLCDLYGIDTGIKIREDASEKGMDRMAEEARLYKMLGYKKWAKLKGYGMRWVCTEGIFSATKRIFGEYVRATKKRNMYHEAKLKFWAYQQLKNLA